MTSMGIPSFTEDEEDTGDVSNPGGGSTGGSGGANNGDDQEDDNARMMQAMGLTGPGFTNRGGGDDSPSLIDRVLGRTTTGINTLKDRLGNRFDRTKNYLTDPSNLKNMATTALLTSLFGPLGMVLSGIGRTGQFQNFLGNLKKDDLPLDTNTIEDTELRSLKPNFLLADVSQMDLGVNKMRGSNTLDLNSFRDLSGNPTLTEQELKGIRDGTITAPTGRFIT
jgi:hypothetical protein